MTQRFSIICFSIIAAAAAAPRAHTQALDFTAVDAEVDFARSLRDWDGFGFNYVETAQTRDYAEYPQEYGGWSLLSEDDRARVVDLVFGNDGLKVGLIKMFLDPFHQDEAGGAFDHATTTVNMRAFVRAGLERTRDDGRDLTIITTLYGPPAYMTKQKVWRGRDLDPDHADDLALYLVDWVRYLRKEEGLPVAYVSLHNEGESWRRWNREGITDYAGHDFNLYWPPGQVVDFLKRLPPVLEKAGLGDVGVTPGETTNWYRFGTWGYADAIAADPEALAGMALVTSHGFYSGGYGRWFGEHKSTGIDLLREARPELHTWVTSTSWSQMDSRNVKEMHGNIYTAKVNGIVPWAGIQRPPHWVEGDPNPGSAFRVSEEGDLEVRRGFFVYKQVSRAGQPGMSVAWTRAMDSEIAVIGFGADGTTNPDAVVIVNIGEEVRKVRLAVHGSNSTAFQGYRTTDDGRDNFADVGRHAVDGGAIVYEAPAGSVTTFFGLP